MKISRVPAILSLLIASILSSGQSQSANSAALRIQQIMKTRSDAGDFSGTVLVAREGRILYDGAFGLANKEWDIPNDLRTKFEIGSMTKQFTALLVLQFVNEGKIRLDGHLSDYLPYYRQETGRRVTISQLLSHTSGVPNFIQAPGFLDGPASRVRYKVKEFAQQ